MPGTVTEVSATLVAKTMRLPALLPDGWNTFCWSLKLKRPYKGKICQCFCSCLRKKEARSRISRSPGRKISTSPLCCLAWRSCCSISSRVCWIALCRSWSWSTLEANKGRYQTSTGKVRPLTSTTGAWSKCLLKRSRSMVAEVIMSFKSDRRPNNCFR